MKLATMMVVAAAATCAFAMPTKEEMEKAGLAVQSRLQKQLIRWLDGEMADAEMAKVLLVMADKETDDARRYVCLQAALAAFARAGDASAAVKTLERMRAETKGFTPEIERAVVDKAVAKAPAGVAAAIRGAAAAPAGEYRDDFFGRLDAKSAEELRRMKAAMLDKITFDAGSNPGEVVTWLLDQVAAKDGMDPIAFTLHDVPPNMKPFYASRMSAYDALWTLFKAQKELPILFFENGRMDVYFSRAEFRELQYVDCEYEIVNDAAAERFFGELEPDGLPKRLSDYASESGAEPVRHWFSFEGKFDYASAGERGVLKLVCEDDDRDEVLRALEREGVKYALASRKTVAQSEVKGVKKIRRRESERQSVLGPMPSRETILGASRRRSQTPNPKPEGGTTNGANRPLPSVH